MRASRLRSGSTKNPEFVEVLVIDNAVSELLWHHTDLKLFIGSTAGEVYLCSIHTSLVSLIVLGGFGIFLFKPSIFC